MSTGLYTAHIGSVFLRLFHGVMGDRMERLLPIDERQKGFRKGDGIFPNPSLLHRCIKEVKTKKRNLIVAFLNMRKAFDSVGHGALWVACRRLGVPEHLIRDCSMFYKESSTWILLGGDKLSDRIQSRRGIKQGDPLSVHLFNAVTDFCTEKLNRKIGFDIDSNTVNFLAFADDLVVLADSNEGLDVNCRHPMDALSLVGFQANAEKSATLNIKARRGKWVCDDKTILNVEGNQVPSISITKTYKYLGAPVGAELSATDPSKKLTSWLERLTRAPLKPQQRLFLLRVYVLPKLYHQLTMLETSRKTQAPRHDCTRRCEEVAKDEVADCYSHSLCPD